MLSKVTTFAPEEETLITESLPNVIPVALLPLLNVISEDTASTFNSALSPTLKIVPLK